ncbi:MAG: hypothetical protein HFH68_02090 [Lachnospiraceae bacterium]|nr:hypothetical protein [Lachnospiraceae bacterium]
MRVKKMIELGLFSVVVALGAPQTMPVVATVVVQAEENNKEDGSVQYATVSSVDGFRDYIDNDGVYASQDSIETKWGGYTDAHKIVLEEPGTLYLAALADGNDVDVELFGNYALTAKIGGSIKTTPSDRAEIKGFDLEAGTYYFRGSRWNGYKVPFVVTVYAGFVPDDLSSVSKAVNVYDSTSDSVPINEIPVVQDEGGLKDYVMGDGQFAWQDAIETKWSGNTDTYSFTVQEDGWLFAYPVAEDNGVNWTLYSNRDLTSCLVSEKTMVNVDGKPYSVYLKAGTYYCRGERWNGYKVPFEVTTYMGFMPASSRFSVQDIQYNSSKSEATVTFNYSQEYLPSFQSGTVRMVEGTVHPCDGGNNEVWKTSTRENVLESASVVIKKNGDYTVRIANPDIDENFCMAYFTVDGLRETGSSEEVVQSSKPIAPAVTVAKRGKKTVKGTSAAYAKVTVKVAGKVYNTVSDGNGKWSVKLGKKLKKGNVVKVYITGTQTVNSNTVSYKVK